MKNKSEVWSLGLGVMIVAVASFFLVFSAFAAENESWMQKIKGKLQKTETAKTEKAAAVEGAKKVEADMVAPVVPTVVAPVKEEEKVEPIRKERKDMTKNELADDIVKSLDREESIIGMVPGLAKKRDPDGKEYYTYMDKRFEDLDRDTLDKIFGRVRNEALRIRTDKLNRQLETVKRAGAMSATAPRVPKVPVSPGIKTPPRVPRSVQPPSKLQAASPSKPPVPPTPPTPPTPPAPSRR